MISVQSRDELDKMASKKPVVRTPDPASTAQAPPSLALTLNSALSPELEKTLGQMAQQIAAAAHMAAESHQSIRTMLADRKNVHLEGEIVRDKNGKMAKVIITIGK